MLEVKWVSGGFTPCHLRLSSDQKLNIFFLLVQSTNDDNNYDDDKNTENMNIGQC